MARCFLPRGTDWAQLVSMATIQRRKTADGEVHYCAYSAEMLPFLSAQDQKNHEIQRRWWTEKFGPLALVELRPGIITAQRRAPSRRGSKGRPISTTPQNRYVAALSAVLTYGVTEREWLETHPAHNVPRIAERRGRVRLLDADERVRLLQACRESRSPRLYPLVLTAISTGMRRSELLRLRWRDLDEERGVAVVHQSKNHTRRAVPRPPPALVALASFDSTDRDRLEFASAQGKATLPKIAWLRGLEVAEIDDFTFHDCRHTTASYLAMSGVTLTEIANTLGHKTFRMVKRYAHLTEQHTVALSQRMEARLLS